MLLTSLLLTWTLPIHPTATPGPDPAVPPPVATATRLDSEAQERVGIAWFEAFNRGKGAMQAFREAHLAEPRAEGWGEQYETLRKDFGRLEVQGVEILDENNVRFEVESETQGSLSVSVAFDAEGKITGLRIGPGRANPYEPLHLGTDDPTEAIDAYLRQAEVDGEFSGVVLLARGGEVWFERAYGLASREFRVPNTVDTRFDVGSFNKDYTRLAIMQLVQDGAVDLEDKVGEHLPDYPNARVRDEVTLRQLLDHRSGLGDYFDGDYLATPMQQLRDIDDYIPIWGPKPLEYEPGTREQYSNYGYTVLGAVLEAVTGMSYPEYVVARIFEPAGMARSGFFEVDGIEPDVAVGYTWMDGTGRRGDRLHKNIFLEPIMGGPWGKSYSTARDLFRFFEALFGHELLDPGLDWIDAGWEGQAALAGGGPGLSAVLLTDGGHAVIALSNQDAPGAELLGERILEALLRGGGGPSGK